MVIKVDHQWVIECAMTLCYTWTSINRGLGKDVTHTKFFWILYPCFLSYLFSFKTSYKLFVRTFKVYNSSNTFVVKFHTLSTNGVLCCLYLIVNFQVKTQVPLWGKYHKRKVIPRLQQVLSFRVNVVVTKIFFKLFLSAFCVSLY